jgi:hypothetical protein
MKETLGPLGADLSNTEAVEPWTVSGIHAGEGRHASGRFANADWTRRYRSDALDVMTTSGRRLHQVEPSRRSAMHGEHGITSPQP